MTLLCTIESKYAFSILPTWENACVKFVDDGMWSKNTLIREDLCPTVTCTNGLIKIILSEYLVSTKANQELWIQQKKLIFNRHHVQFI